MRVLFVIPARIGSSRLPHKPLCRLLGQPLVRWTVSNALEIAPRADLVVASDSRAVLEAVADLDVTGIITSGVHGSGTERVAEVLRMPLYRRYDAVVNLQCDQPFLSSDAVRGALTIMASGFPVGTAAAPLDPCEMANPGRVKVQVDSAGNAVWFSRSPIEMAKPGTVRHHIGVYAYRRDAILRWAELPPCEEERVERLEQLRPLLHGVAIGVASVGGPAPLAIDTPADLDRARRMLDEPSGELRLRMSA